MGKHLVLVGGGHAHMMTLAGLHNFVQKGHRVTVIGPSDHHYYSGMGPGMLSRIYTPEQIRFATRKVVEQQGGVFIRDTVIRINPEEQTIYTQSGDTCRYDVISFNAGSYVPDDVAGGPSDDIYAAKPIERLLQAQEKLITLIQEKSLTVSVVGGGAAALEIAGNVRRLLSDQNHHDFKVMVYTRGGLMERFPRRLSDASRRFLKRRGIQLFENCRVIGVQDKHIKLDSGETYPSDITFLATGVRPSPIFRASSLPTGDDGGLSVNTFLQSIAYTNIYGGGDCIHYMPQPLDKVGVYAVRQNPVLYHNLMAALEGEPPMAFTPGGAYLLIFNTGDGGGILYKKGFMLGGRLAFIIKDYIDRRFMKKFQAIE